MVFVVLLFFVSFSILRMEDVAAVDGINEVYSDAVARSSGEPKHR